MKNWIIVLSSILILTSCTKVPITGRRQLNLLPEDQMVATALAQYNEFLVKNPPVALSNNNADMVNRLGNKLSIAVVKFLAEKKQSQRVAGFKWEFNLVENKEANAWCMPGGKVVVYTGLLPITKDETGLAFVMGHEIAHAVARHGNERMSQQLAVQSGGMALDIAMMQQPNETRQLFNMAYGLGSNLGAMLPFSRLHESEADKLGMIFMALAGYNPTNASNVWARMAAGGGQKPPEILSTHPSDAKRKNDMDKFLPEAMKYYKPQ
ncbi:MAG: M48 family metallopeptidase [Bacteroidia bacterium]|nr:M48 family metallopeptidase [Bacteroidia bacterium]